MRRYHFFQEPAGDVVAVHVDKDGKYWPWFTPCGHPPTEADYLVNLFTVDDGQVLYCTVPLTEFHRSKQINEAKARALCPKLLQRLDEWNSREENYDADFDDAASSTADTSTCEGASG